jgi:hypothetical protein
VILALNCTSFCTMKDGEGDVAWEGGMKVQRGSCAEDEAERTFGSASSFLLFHPHPSLVVRSRMLKAGAA